MVQKFEPEINKVYFINQYSLVQIFAGSGTIEVDFKNYTQWQDKAIYLSKGQYIKFLSNDFSVRIIEFPDEVLFKSKDVRVLFKHLIALGYIDFAQCEDCQQYLSNTVFNNNNLSIIDISTKQWYWQNPFQASIEEYQLIFDAKDIVDQQYTNNLSTAAIVSIINAQGNLAQKLVKDKIGLSIKSLMTRKKILESKRQVAFTAKPLKEIAYSMGYKDPAYFNRVFTNQVGQNPNAFRNAINYKNRDTFIQDVLELIKTHHNTQHQIGFYADQLHISVKHLAKKTQEKMHTSIGKLIRSELITTAQQLLLQETPINQVAYSLGFQEANHFSSFFKNQTGYTPSEFRIQKVQ